MKNLLPPNSTELEKNVSEELGNNSKLPVNLRSLITLENVSENFLPHLAWEHSVDRWQQNWPDEIKKQQIKSSFDVHKYKGTNYALRKIVESFGYSLTIYEWWQEVPMNEPGTFQILIDTNEKSLTEQSFNTLIQLLNDASPLTRHCINIQINAAPIYGQLHTIAGCYSSEDTTILPEVQDAIISATPIWAFYEQTETEIYPFGVNA